MENKNLDEIKKRIIMNLQARYGFCGVAEGDDFAILNSTDTVRNKDIKITIKTEDAV